VTSAGRNHHLLTMPPEGRPVRREPDPVAVREFVTPTENHYLIAHLGVPQLAADAVQRWSLAVSGDVERPLSLTIGGLRELPARELAVTLECTGDPRSPDLPIRRVSTARWRGVPLADLLERAAPRATASHLWNDGADHGVFRPGPDPGRVVPEYRKDLPIADALDADALVAYEMNGAPVPVAHGGPLRLVVPGHYGTNSVKWLSRVTVASGRAQALFASDLYNVDTVEDGVLHRRHIGRTAVNTRITDPLPGTPQRVGPQRVAGWAWSAYEVAAVEVRIGSAGAWTPAALEPRTDRAWQRFHLDWTADSPGRCAVAARATDVRGRVQPADVHINQIAEAEIDVLPA
jgi:sulfane dehydrogenase subunit SoxC